MLDMVGVPVHRLVTGKQLVLDLAGGDVPRGLGVVQQRGAAAPAVRIGVLVGFGSQQSAASAQFLDEIRIGGLDVAPGVQSDPLVVGAVQAHRVDDVQSLDLAEAEV